MKLSEVIKIDDHFEKSVNLTLDLDNPERVSLYIPTRSSVAILGSYFKNVDAANADRATILIGPYGKGKSHLLLVLLALLSGKRSEASESLKKRIGVVNPEVGMLIDKVTSDGKPILPVIVNPGTASLSEAFLRGLMQALKRQDLETVSPSNHYSEAVKTIRLWKEKYPGTYENFKLLLGMDGADAEAFATRIESMDAEALDRFKEMYPALTSGGTFNPMIADEIIEVYRSVNRVLCEKYGYKGIHIVFDEFSKYVEGHPVDSFSADMKILQDMCELANNSKDEQIHLTCVAHKSIKAYGNRLSKDVLNAFRGVEGRLKEVSFIISSQNSYELISDAIIKKPEFYDWSAANENFVDILSASYQLPGFRTLFKEDEFSKIVGEGCYPMSPVASMLLLLLSEKVAQNERTVFTFLTDKTSGLNSFVAGCDGMGFANTDLVYDYFVPQCKDEQDETVHGEWLKAEYALSKTEDENAKKVVKALAVIKMTKRSEDLPASEKNIRLACGLPDEEFGVAVNLLKESELIIYRVRNGAYEFKNSIGVDVEKAVYDCMKSKFAGSDIVAALNDTVSTAYILPKKHNQDHSITRYYDFKYMSVEAYLALKSFSYLEFANRPDGVIVLLYGNDIERDKILSHAAKLKDDRIAVILPQCEKDISEKVRYLLAVKSLIADKGFIEDNIVLKKELENVQFDTEKEIEDWLGETYLSAREVILKTGARELGANGLNRLVSDICDEIYKYTPVINNELINRHNISAQNLKARNTIIESLIAGCNYEMYADGTGPADTIGRATLLNSAGDSGVLKAKEVIHAFILSCEGQKNCVSALFEKLMAPPFGMRLGVIPIYLTECLMALDDVPVFYSGNKELELSVETINNCSQRPDDYSLYIEKETAEKEAYLTLLEEVFADYANKCKSIDKRNRFAKLACVIQAWFRALPQTSKTFRTPDYEGQNIAAIEAFRKLFMGIYINAREVIFDSIPRCVCAEDYNEAAAKVAQIRKDVDTHIAAEKEAVEKAIRKTFSLDKKSDLMQSLKEWYREKPDSVKEALFDGSTQALITSVIDLSTSDTAEIVNTISRAAIGSFVEDYNDASLEQLTAELNAIRQDIEKREAVSGDTGSRIVMQKDDGIERAFTYNFDKGKLSSTGTFFSSALEDLMDEFDSSVGNDEKVGILMDAIKKLLG